MRAVVTTLEQIARTDLPLVITGERGSGKEWAARFVHHRSARGTMPFAVLDCGMADHREMERAIYGVESMSWAGVNVVPGLLEETAGGTLLLDEALRLPAPLVMRLARVVEYGNARRFGARGDYPVSTRLVATLTAAADEAEAAVRAEPWQRISPVVVEMPPLRSRREDVPVYVGIFLEEMRKRFSSSLSAVAPEAMELLTEASWPGNVRGLKNVLEHAAIVSDGELLLPEHLPDSVRKV
jgi:DNA-binding NtrC family response regulator